MSSIPPIGGPDFNISGSGTQAFDQNYSLIQQVNAVWEMGNVALTSNPPNELAYRGYIKAILNLESTLNGLIKQNGPPTSANPCASALEQLFNFQIYSGDSLSKILNSNTNTPSVLVGWLQGSKGQEMMEKMQSTLCSGTWTSTENYDKDRGNTTVEQNILTLQSDISAYQSDPSPENARQLACDMNALYTSLQTINGDGYLALINMFLHTSFADGGTDGFFRFWSRSISPTTPLDSPVIGNFIFRVTQNDLSALSSVLAESLYEENFIS